MRTTLVLSFLIQAFAASAALSQSSSVDEAAPAVPPGRLHKLAVAVGGDRPQDFPAARVDQIVDGMNQLLTANCSGIKVSWDGNIHYNANLLAGGTDDALTRSFKAAHMDPAINVYWVYSIDDCGGIQAAGCTPVPGWGQIVIDDQDDRAKVVWLHERGHAEGLGHVQQDKDENAIPPADAENVMFWKALISANLLTPAQCTSYRRLTVGAGLHNGVVAVPLTEVQAAPVAAAPAAAPTATTAPASPLTPAAAEAIRWSHHVAVDKLKALSDDDLRSMADAILNHDPGPTWPHIVTALGYRNSKDFAAVKDRVMGLGPVDVPAQTPSNTAEVLSQSQKSRALIAAKLAVPLATGLFVNQSGNIDAAFDLARYSQPNVAAELVGRSLSPSFSDSAATALVISTAKPDAQAANDVGAIAQQVFAMPDAQPTAALFGQTFRFANGDVESRLNATNEAAPAPKVQLDPEKAARLKAVASKVTKDGLDFFLVNGAPVQ